MKILPAFCFLFLAVSCNTKQCGPDLTRVRPDFVKDRTTLYLRTVTVTGPDSNRVKKEEIISVTADYFEISLHELPNDLGYAAEKNIPKPTYLEKPGPESAYICDWCGAALTFRTTSGFLNFMSVCRYELVSEAKKNGSIDYEFRKKQSNC